jgi:uncharacterized protein YqgC (DUF456 family)
MIDTALMAFIALSFAGLLWSVFCGMGTLLIFLGALFLSYSSAFQVIPIITLVFLFCLFLLGELCEYLLVLWGARSFGSSKRAAWGALAGGVIGFLLSFYTAFIGLLPFVILGIFMGGFVVELCHRKDIKQAIKSGAGGLFGKLGASLVKVTLTVLMIAIVVLHLMRADMFVY